MALFCSQDFIFHITFGRITFESCTFLLFKYRNNLEVILTTESSEWLFSHLPYKVSPPCPCCTERSIPFSHLLPMVSTVLLQGPWEERINTAEGCYEYTVSVAGKAQSFHLIFPNNPSEKFYYLVRAVLQGSWMNYQNPKHSRPSLMPQHLCKEEWEQCPAPPVGSSREILQEAL